MSGHCIRTSLGGVGDPDRLCVCGVRGAPGSSRYASSDGVGDEGDEGKEEGTGDVRPREKMGTTSCVGVQTVLQTGQEGWVESHWGEISTGGIYEHVNQ